MAQGNQQGGAAKKAASSKATGTDKPEPKDTTQTSADTQNAPDPAEVERAAQEQREQEQQDALAAAQEQQQSEATGAASAADKGRQTRAAADVREQAAADAEARAQAAEGDGIDRSATEGGDDSGSSEDPVQRQRREEAEARDAAAREADESLSDEDRRLLGAAPGGQRTAMTKGREGSTTVKHTAAQSRPPLSGPLDAPVTQVENYAATEEDPDNRVYADEAGPRDVFENTEPTKARYVDADGNALDYDAIFEDNEGKTFVTSKTRVYEVFTFPNSTTEGKRLAYAQGRRVPRGEAENVRNQISVHSPIL